MSRLSFYSPFKKIKSSELLNDGIQSWSEGRWWLGFLGNSLCSCAHRRLNLILISCDQRNQKHVLKPIGTRDSPFEDVCLCTNPDNAWRYLIWADGCCIRASSLAHLHSCYLRLRFFDPEQWPYDQLFLRPGILRVPFHQTKPWCQLAQKKCNEKRQ